MTPELQSQLVLHTNTNSKIFLVRAQIYPISDSSMYPKSTTN